MQIELIGILRAIGTTESVHGLERFRNADRNHDRELIGKASEAIRTINERERKRK